MMQKKALLAMLLVLSLVLSGCALIKKDEAVDAATEIIRLGDQVVLKGEVMEQINGQLNYMNYVYSIYGMSFDPTSATAIADARDAVIESYKTELVSKAKIAELGLDQLTAEEEEKLKTDAEASYKEYVDSAKATDYAESDLPEEEIEARISESLAANGTTLESITEGLRESMVSDKLREHIVQDVVVTDEEIKADYDAKVAENTETYTDKPSDYCSAANNGTELYWAPEGIRRVKQILIQFSTEDQAAITEAQTKVSAAQAIIDSGEDEHTQEEKDQAQKDLEEAQKQVETLTNEAYSHIDAEADEVLEKIAAGEDWDELTKQYNDDPGMQEGRDTAKTGYAVCKDMASFDSAFVEAAMALEKIDDVSAKTRGSSNGYYIIRYVGDVPAGEIGLDAVRQEIHDTLLKDKQDDTYTSTLEAWVEEQSANFKIDLGALNN